MAQHGSSEPDAILSNLSGRDFLTLAQLTPAEIDALINLGIQLKADRGRVEDRSLLGKSIGLLFFKHSTRTRLSFEVAAYELGAHPLILQSDHMQLDRGESIEDTAQVMSRYLHAIVIRTYGHDQIERFATAASIPVINALTDSYHPAQVLADLMTLKERFGSLKGLKLSYVGDGNNVSHSLMIGGCLMGMDVRVATPAQYAPDAQVVSLASSFAEASGGRLTLLNDPKEAVDQADAVYTDTWVSMGQDHERDQKLSLLTPYQVNADLMAKANANAVVMHCLPAHVGEEITADVYSGPQSVVFDQAENRLHVQKALLKALLS